MGKARCVGIRTLLSVRRTLAIATARESYPLVEDDGRPKGEFF
jgi:hypothetical protein